MDHFELMQHQKDAIWKSQFDKDIFLAWAMGTGKSCATIQMIRDRCTTKGGLCKTLILAPLIVLKNWKKEFDKFSKIPQKDIHILEGPIIKRIEAVERQQGFNCIFITNYDSLQNAGLTMALRKWAPEILVCDEAHVLKNHKSIRAKNVAQIADLCKNRYLLTGTPVLNNAMDVFMQYRILDGYLGKESTFGSNFFVFRANYFYDENASWSAKPGYFPKWIPRESAYQELMDKIKKKTLRVTKEECLDLPPLVVQDLDVELGHEQAKLYKEMEREFVTYVEDELNKGTALAVVARLAVTKSLRLQQIVSGFVNVEGGETVRIKKNPRLDVLRELLEMLTPDHKVIIWAGFKENYKMIAEVCDALKVKYVEIHGDVPNKEKFANAEKFNSDKEIRVLIGNPGSGGVGISLVSSTYSIYYSRNFKLNDDLQSESRNHRRGSEVHSRITRINLISRNTIDELIAEVLASKLDISERIMDFARKI